MIARPLKSLAGSLIVALLLIMVLDGCGSASPRATTSAVQIGPGFAGAALPALPPAPGVRLRDQEGQSMSFADLRGQVAIVAFLYTHCGAACTVIAQQIRGALDDLGAPVPVLLVSVDPAADTRASVRRLLARVGLAGRVRYLTGTRAQLQLAWRAFHVAPPSRGRGGFGRAAPVFVLDRAGRPRVIFQLEQLTPEGLAHDVRALRREPG
jgi:protein SCO1/2